MQGERIKTIKYVDDQGMLTELVKELQFVTASIAKVGKEFGMKTNVGNTKVMRFASMKALFNIPSRGKPVKQANSHKYLSILGVR